eukprot:gnl/MRDRNA2_/MRDRNA2_96708_c0_seq1.p1 gnl/MRDRNA2_/MRDRNA2_96708_c0~~gnl/MRDRNA2_/MRDRNA2_96708_c0_seq1.p1  ORF type:complete len:406 (-),score=101.88 gnl/MRDRNA2_/MRDRNA2_96708_c0_seq1:11-1183(-)
MASKGKGKGVPPPPKPPSDATAAPKIIAKAPAKPGLKKGLSFAEERELRFKKEEEKNAKFELGAEDIPEHETCEAGPMVTCPRCHKEIREAVFQSHWDAHSSEILPWLFLGGQRNAENEKELVERTQITHLLCVAAEANSLHRDIQKHGLVQKVIPLVDNDTQDLLPHIEEITDFIKSVRDASSSNRVLVYCIQGISRSASSVIAYLMKHEVMTLREAFEHVKERRRVADPRPMFVDALGKLELELFPNLGGQPTLTAAEVVGDRKLLSLNTAQQDAAEKAIIEEQQRQKKEQKHAEVEDEDAVEIKVTMKQNVRFYKRAAATFLKGTETKKAVKRMRVQALGKAVDAAVSVAAHVEKDGLGVITKIQTAYPEMTQNVFCCQILIDINAI